MLRLFQTLVNSGLNKYGSIKNCSDSSLSAPDIFIHLQVWDKLLAFFVFKKGAQG